MIEDAGAIENIADILALDTVDGVFVGRLIFRCAENAVHTHVTRAILPTSLSLPQRQPKQASRGYCRRGAWKRKNLPSDTALIRWR